MRIVQKPVLFNIPSDSLCERACALLLFFFEMDSGQKTNSGSHVKVKARIEESGVHLKPVMNTNCGMIAPLSVRRPATGWHPKVAYCE